MTDKDKLPKVLVVDDMPENLLAMGKLLKPLNVDVVKANSGEEALAQVLRNRFAVILLDVQMPVMDGFETAQLMRANKATASIPIIFVTAISKEDRHVTMGYQSGAVDYLYKPVNPDILLGKVKVFLQLEEQRLEMEALTDNLRDLSEKNQLLLDSAGEGIIGISPDGVVEFANPAARELLDVDENELKSKPVFPWFYDPGVESFIQSWKENETSEPVYRQTSRMKRLTGDSKPVEFNLSPVHNKKGEVTGGVLVFHDITERVQLEEHLTKMAKYDNLTGLANRTLFMEFLNASLARSERRGRGTAVMFLDLDHFKQINDTLGHDVGDDLLISVAERLHECVREGDMIARLGGDEFSIVLDDVARADDVKMVAEKIVETISKPHQLAGRELHVSTSVGVSTWPECGKEANELIKAADIAMYVTKKAGRKGYRFFTADMQAEGQRRAKQENALKDAVRNGSFSIVYQPIVSLDTGAVAGYESQLRWNYEGKVLVPDDFLPMVESLRLMNQLGGWTLDNVCRESKSWRGSDGSRDDVFFAVNLALSQCRDVDVQDMVEKAIANYGVAPHMLELEISERIVNDIPGKLINSLNVLREQGVHVALDNFGSGVSALNYLRKLPVDVVKVDQLYIREIGKDSRVEGILKAMTGLAHDMGMRVVAEGVDSQEQLAFLKDLGYDRAQGLLIGRAESITRIDYETFELPLSQSVQPTSQISDRPH
ncbi:GGDEF/EAL domain-containing response regulator [Sansalvadorimonas verongulae]|uniref:GGDEF/EAL domain-containing response regulator n=1 Tax=Sansalvadorimonas verongulae TaxID=2172824 RepID=UPI0012BBB8D8|nr:EAL domain-containing protein [Sansalvadorimonas verongulae]MTI14620.1 EAL domain-containing protein [Sansalvadorimonas verongulae]